MHFRIEKIWWEWVTLASLTSQCPSLLITDPAMDTTPTRKDPQDVLESKVLAEALVDHLGVQTGPGVRTTASRLPGQLLVEHGR